MPNSLELERGASLKRKKKSEYRRFILGEREIFLDKARLAP